MHKEFCKETALNCSLSTFGKYKPFSLFPATEREKESSVCKICQKAHSPLAAINTFRRSQDLPSQKSVSNFLSINLLKTSFQGNKTVEANLNLYPERFCERNINCYIFHRKMEDKRESVNLVMQNLMNKEVKYLKHRSHVKNISVQSPIIK